MDESNNPPVQNDPTTAPDETQGVTDPGAAGDVAPGTPQPGVPTEGVPTEGVPAEGGDQPTEQV